MEQTEIDKKLYSTMWKNQCKEIDTELLDFEDVVLVQKCIHQQEITDDELKRLRLILKDYTNINNQFNLSEMEENITVFKNEISSEKEFLDLVDAQGPRKLTKEYVVAGKPRKVNFIIKPIVDSRAIYDIVEHADIFAQLTDKEQELYNKANNGTLNEREAKMLDRLNNKVQRLMATSENMDFVVDNFLAKHVELEHSTLTTDEERLEFWGKVDGLIKADLFNTVRDMLNINGDFFR